MAIFTYNGTADTDATTYMKRIYSVTIMEGAGTPAAATVYLRNGSVTGNVQLGIKLAASESKVVTFHPDRPLLFPDGVFVDMVAGSVRLCIDYA